jgi:hypothetical protein
MVDHPALDLVVAGEARKDGKAGGVCRSPARGAKLVRAQAPDRPGAGTPPATFRIERVELVETASRAVDDQRVPVAGGRAPALDLDVARNGIRAAVGLVRVVERDARFRLLAADDGDRDPVGAPFQSPEPKSACRPVPAPIESTI